MVISVKLLAKYVIIIYALLGSVHEKFGVLLEGSKVAPKAKFPAGLGEKNVRAVPN